MHHISNIFYSKPKTLLMIVPLLLKQLMCTMQLYVITATCCLTGMKLTDKRISNSNLNKKITAEEQSLDVLCKVFGYLIQSHCIWVIFKTIVFYRYDPSNEGKIKYYLLVVWYFSLFNSVSFLD